MTADLLPCPFCGGEAELWNAHDNRPAWIACMGRCAVLISKEHATDAEAIAAWNTRAALPARGVPDYTLAPHLQKIVDGAKAAPKWDTQADRLAPTLSAALALPEVAALVKALNLAANRLDRLAVDYIPGGRLFIETSEWAAEARAALANLKDGAK